jgi:hypothetical protein
MAQSSLLRTSFKRDFAFSYTTAADRLFTFCGGRQNSQPNFLKFADDFSLVFQFRVASDPESVKYALTSSGEILAGNLCNRSQIPLFLYLLNPAE